MTLEYLEIMEDVKRKKSSDLHSMVWLTLEAKGLIEVRRELYNLTSKIDKCFVINEALVRQPK